MAFKNYIKAVAASETVVLCTVATGKELAVVEIVITAGDSDWDFILIIEDASANTFKIPLHLIAKETTIIDNAHLLSSGYSIKIESTTGAGTVMLSADEYSVS